MEKQETKRLESPPQPTILIQKPDGTTEPEQTARFSPKLLAKHREKLGLAAAEYARLVGCSPLSIYKWEKGESTPRAEQREALAAVRGIVKREAKQRLALLGDQ